MNEVEQTEVDDTTEQDSPTVEENEVETEDTDTGENLEETPELEEETPEDPKDKNWRAIREELDALKTENKRLKGEESTPQFRNDMDSAYLSPEEISFIDKEQFKAELKYPELERRNPFTSAVYGEFRMQLENYEYKKTMGIRVPLPSMAKVADQLKAEMTRVSGTSTKKLEQEGARKAREAKQSREATVEAEGRSDRGKRSANSAELGKLQEKTRLGDGVALAERLSRSGL